MSSISNTLLQDALDTRDTHGGCISNGGWVLLTLANIASPELSNSSRFKSYDDLISHVQHCIGAGCEPLLSPAPAQESQSASIPAPAEVGQGQGTITLEQFQRWLENKAHNSAAVIGATEPRFSWSGDAYLDHSLVIAECRVATKLLMQFKLEQGV